MIFKENRYNQIQEIEEGEKTTEENYDYKEYDNDNDNYNNNNEYNLVKESKDGVNDINICLVEKIDYSPSTRQSSSRDLKVKNIFGKEYIELYSNQNIEMQINY